MQSNSFAVSNVKEPMARSLLSVHVAISNAAERRLNGSGATPKGAAVFRVSLAGTRF